MLSYRGTTPDPRQVRRELRVRYMLSGSVRRVGDKVRLSAELVDCEHGATIWSDRFAGEAAHIFELQDELSARVVATITPQVQETELRRVLRKRPENLDAYECVLRGLDLFNCFEDDQFMRALPLPKSLGGGRVATSIDRDELALHLFDHSPRLRPVSDLVQRADPARRLHARCCRDASPPEVVEMLKLLNQAEPRRTSSSGFQLFAVSCKPT